MNIIEGGITAPKGFLATGEHVGVKKVKKDLAIIYSEKPALCSAVFTKNLVKAPPLWWCEKLVKEKQKIQAIVINSGNANACTGDRGYQDALAMADTLSECLNIKKESVLVTSTGVIGVYLPMDKIIPGIKETSKTLGSDEKSAKRCAKAIMTTDTFRKEIAVEIDIKGKKVKLAGIAKGSGMIHPNMATMLGFITTDINISQELLDKAFKENINDSFNMITVDGETSTNDMAVILANGLAENPIVDKEDEDYEKFKTALDYITKYLAKQIVKDGEGATKFLECQIFNAKSKEDARVLCKAILNSNLVKTAFFGNDANWGRILSAMGASGVDFDPNQVKISFKNDTGEIKLFENGLPVEFDEDFAFKILKQEEIKILIDMNRGLESIIGWGCDLSFDYVKINAEYRT
ncbi:MAG TPA: bifunctional ornithine acetyltransferase/N-acetylglutamate synthase [Candidatus Adamsella sp.]|nr:bifunctional ornithine acetyltransferase/N-acetylglutamate synthase [Candidatus Adamsella sp.]